MTDSQPPPVSGLVAGKYEVVHLIGRGGMGSVWEGRHASLGTRVAIKFIDPEYANSQEARSRFVTEARAAATIHSKHAIQIYDHGVTDGGRPYMVMELLLGEPLDRRIERLGRISLQETARVLGQVSRALQRAHDAGIIHRDLKPENIFLVRSPDDDDETAKVLDFGIAKIKAPPGDKGLTSSTKTGAVLGTPYYMSPEQARGLRAMDHRTDLWSLGVIAYKCVTGVLPFDGESVGDLLVKICTAPPPTPSLTMPGLPASFDAWFVRALDREPSRRFASASELSEALGLAAGVSVRRAATSGSSEPGESAITTAAQAAEVSVAPYAPTIQGFPVTPLSAGGSTSAPFTASASSPRSARGLLLTVVAAALIGGSIGVIAVVKLATTQRAAAAAGTSNAAAANPPARRSESALGVDAMGAAVNPSIAATVGASSLDPSGAGPEQAATATAAVPRAPAAHGAPKSPVAVAAPTKPWPTSTGPAPLKPPPVLAAPTSADPGY